MGQAIPRQQPAFVLRSHFTKLRALLAVAAVAVVGLTAAVVILATEDEVDTSGSSLPAPPPATRYEGDPGIFGPPSTRYDRDPGIFGPGLRWDGDPGIFGPSPRYDGDWVISPPPPAMTASATETRDEAGTAAAIGQSAGRTEFRGSKASEDGTSARP
jgi:hypothetical protein